MINTLIHTNLSNALREINYLRKQATVENEVIQVDNLKKIIPVKVAAENFGIRESQVKRIIKSGAFWIVNIERKLYIDITFMEYYKQKYLAARYSHSNDNYIEQRKRQYLTEDEENLIEKIEILTEEVKKLRTQIKENSLGNMFIAKVCKAILMTKAAEILSCPISKIKRLMNTGELEGVIIGGKQYITIKSLLKIQTPIGWPH